MKRSRVRLGATGQFPDGKINADDEGELQFIVGNDKGGVLLEFGKSVRWLMMPAGSARALAALLVKHADAVDGKNN